MVHFNWSPGNRLAMPDHPEVKRVFHCSIIVFFMKRYSKSFWELCFLDLMIECYVHVTASNFAERAGIFFYYFGNLFLSLELHCGENTLKEKYEVEMGATVFCPEKFASIKKYNYPSPGSSSSLSQFPSNCHFISCSWTFTCISATPLNVTAVFAHLQNALWVITKDWENLFSERALALEFNWGQYCALLMVCYNSNTNNDLGEIAHVSSSHYVHFLFKQQQIQKPRTIAV